MLFNLSSLTCKVGSRQIFLGTFLLLIGLARVPVMGQANVLTYHNDNSRTGQNLSETVLMPSTVNANQFGKLFSYPVDGFVFAQPLYVSGVSIPGQGTHNVVFAATEHDSVYAFDADSNAGANGGLLWQRSFINPAAKVTTISAGDINCADTGNEVGITGTPVIDGTTGTMYVVAVTKENGVFVQRLHALDITTGLDKLGGPVTISAAVPGNGDTSAGGIVSFSPLREHQHCALLLNNGVVSIAWASHGDQGLYHGWVMGYDATSLAQVSVFNTTPNTSAKFNLGDEGGIWMSGDGPAADAQGDNIFFIVGNGASDPSIGAYGDSFIKLSAIGSGPAPADYFTPFNQLSLYVNDTDLGSGGEILLPDSVGSAAHPHLMVGTGKEGKIYLLDRDNLGGFNSNGSGPDNVVQSVPGAITGSWDTPAYFNNTIYYGGNGDRVKAFAISGAHITPTPLSQSPTAYGYLGTTPSISANGNTGGILWALQRDNFNSVTPAFLHAYDATNLSKELYNSNQFAARDNPGPTIKFQLPTVANGKVYIGTQTLLSVFGLLAPLPAAPVPVTATPGETKITLAWTPVAGAVSYTLYRSTTSGGEGATPYKTNLTGSSFTDTGLTDGTLYYYQIATVNAAGTGPTSSELSAIPNAPPGIIANGSFEMPNVGLGFYCYFPPGSGWAFTGNSGIESNGSPWGANNAPDGVQAAFLQGNPNQVSVNNNGSPGSISQNVNFNAGSYVLTFQASQRMGQVQPLKFSVDGVQVGSLLTPSGSNFAPLTTSAFSVSKAGNHLLMLSATNNSGDNSTFVDNVTLTPALPDGNFETPSVGSASYAYNPTGGAWTFSGNSGLQSNGSAWYGANATDGTQTAFLQGNPVQSSTAGLGVLGSLSQSVNFAAAGNYAVTFQAARRLGQVQPVQVSVDGVPVGGLLTPPGSSFGALTSAAFTISGPGVHTISLAATDNHGDKSTLIDQISVIPN